MHLTLTSEWDLYRWGPVTHAPSLLDGDGGFPRTIQEVWDHADLDETRRELRTQIERAIVWGFDVTHLDSHMGTVQLRPEFFENSVAPMPTIAALPDSISPSPWSAWRSR